MPERDTPEGERAWPHGPGVVDRPRTGGDETERETAVRDRMRDPRASGAEKTLATIAGAAEGFAEQSREADLPRLVGDTVENVTETLRKLREAVRPPATEPGELPHGGPEALPATADTLAGQDYVSPLTGPLEGAPPPAMPAPTERRPGEAASRTMERVNDVAEAVGLTARRAAEAPAAIRHEVRSTAREVAKELRKMVVGYGVAGIGAIFSLALLTVVVTVWLNRQLGDPNGTLVVGIVYAIVAGVGFAAARRGTDHAKEDMREGVENVRNEVRDVASAYRRVRG